MVVQQRLAVYNNGYGDLALGMHPKDLKDWTRFYRYKTIANNCGQPQEAELLYLEK
jgi:hypothetical protein